MLVKMGEESFIVLYGTDLVEARVMVDDLLGDYSRRPEVLRIGFSEAWVKSFFFILPEPSLLLVPRMTRTSPTMTACD
jgi:hypothetical protein